MTVEAAPLGDPGGAAPALDHSAGDARGGRGEWPRGWPGRALRVLAFGLDRDSAIVALAGFLVRGGLVLLVAPGVILPSVIGIAGAVGISSFAIDGSPTSQLYLIVFGSIALVLAWLIVAAAFGSLVDTWLIEAASDPERPARRGRALPDAGLLLDMIAIRGICLLPLTGALWWAGQRIYDATYAELMTPVNLAAPIFVRVIERSAGPVAIVVAGWLVSETVSAIAVRRLVLGGSGLMGALLGTLGQIVTRPVSTLATLVTWTAASVAATAAAMAATALAFGWTLDAARMPDPLAITLGVGSLSTTRDFRPVVFLLSAALMAAVWLAGAAISGAASAWRSAAWTGEVEADLAPREPDHRPSWLDRRRPPPA